jgi:hypothetical protein
MGPWQRAATVVNRFSCLLLHEKLNKVNVFGLMFFVLDPFTISQTGKFFEEAT